MSTMPPEVKDVFGILFDAIEKDHSLYRGLSCPHSEHLYFSDGDLNLSAHGMWWLIMNSYVWAHPEHVGVTKEQIHTLQCYFQDEGELAMLDLYEEFPGKLKGEPRTFVKNSRFSPEEITEKFGIPIYDDTSLEGRFFAAKTAVQEWTDKQGHDRCWYYPDILKRLEAILEVEPTKEPSLPPREEFEQGCRRYTDEQYSGLDK